ncbi:MAG: LuxR C-terminal-related transcriptional regulator, partial [Micromonosporaceae bacterium]
MGGKTRGEEPASQLSEAELAVYQHAVTHGHLDPRSAPSDLSLDLNPAEMARACQSLVRLKLLNNHRNDVLTPVHPDLALMTLNQPLVEQIRERERAMEGNGRQLQRISDELARSSARARDAGSVRVVEDPVQVQKEIDAATLRCADELVMTQPSGRGSRYDFATFYPDGRSILKPGVSLRALCPHAARADLKLRSYVGKAAEHDGAVRTTSTVLEQIFIFDQHTAVIPLAPPQEDAAGAAIITHPAVVRFVYRNFDKLWSSALPFDHDDHTYDWASADIKISLLRLMASGLKDDAIASRLGLATRTCRRHMSQIMDELNVTSRFQAGVKIAKLDILSESETSA